MFWLAFMRNLLHMTKMTIDQDNQELPRLRLDDCYFSSEEDKDEEGQV